MQIPLFVTKLHKYFITEKVTAQEAQEANAETGLLDLRIRFK